MTDSYDALLRANDERAALAHKQRVKALHAEQERAQNAHQRRTSMFHAWLVREERGEVVRLKVRELMSCFSDPDRMDGLPADELLVGAVTFAAGMLALMELDEPAGLKVRRIGRLMQTETLLF